MNKINIIFVIGLLIFFGCSEQNIRSDAYGNFESREVIISAEAQGKVLEFNVEEGREVGPGELLGYIDTVSLSLTRDQLKSSITAVLSNIDNIEAQIVVQQQQMDNLVIDRDRIEKLMKDGAATQKQLDDVVGAIRVIERQIDMLDTQKKMVMDEAATVRVQIKQVEDNIDKCYIVNPERGTVLTKYVEANEIATPGRSLYKIADLSRLELKVYISGVQLPYVKIGQQVEVLVDKDDKSNRALPGVVSWISQQAEFTPKIVQTKEERVSLVYAMKVVVENDGSLKIGMPGEVNFMEKSE